MKKLKAPSLVVKRKNRLQTEERMKEGIGEILEAFGHSEVTINKVFKHIGIAKTALYRDFTSFNNLIITYYESIDFRLDLITVDTAILTTERLIDLLMDVIEKTYRSLMKSKIIREFMAWELSDRTNLFKNTNKKREMIHLEFLQKIKPFLKDKAERFEILYAIIYSSINSIVLESKVYPGTHFGINISNEEKRIKLFATWRVLLTLALSE